MVVNWEGNPFELGHGWAVSTNVGDVAIVVLVASEVETIGSILKEYKLAAVSKTNAHNWICDWIERPVKLPAINLVPTSRFRRTAIKCRNQNGQTENCSDSDSKCLHHFHYHLSPERSNSSRLLWKGHVAMVKRSVCCRLSMPCFLVRTRTFRLHYLEGFLKDGRLWGSSFGSAIPLRSSRLEWRKHRYSVPRTYGFIRRSQPSTNQAMSSVVVLL